MIPDDGVWMPELVELNHLAETDAYYGQFGFSELDIPEDCPLTAALHPHLTDRFNQHYALRMIGQETLERWQARLQDLMDSTVHGFERSLRIYAANAELMETPIGSTDTMHAIDTAGGEDTSTGTASSSRETVSSGTRAARYADTPDTATNANEDFGSSVNSESSTGNVTDGGSSNSSSTNKYGRVDTRESSSEHVDNSLIIEQLNDSLDGWRDLETEFIGGFEPAFLQILFY